MTKKQIIKFLEDNSKELYIETLNKKSNDHSIIRWATAHKILKKVNPDFDENIEWAELKQKHLEGVEKFYKTKKGFPYFWRLSFENNKIQ